MVLILVPKGFSPGTPVFPSSKTSISEFQFPLDYFEAFYHEPLAPEIAQAIPFSSTLNKLLYFTAHNRTSTTSSLSLEFSPFDSTSLKRVRATLHGSSLALCAVGKIWMSQIFNIIFQVDLYTLAPCYDLLLLTVSWLRKHYLC